MSQDYSQDQGHQPAAHHYYSHGFKADYAPPGSWPYWDLEQPDPTDDYITVPRQSRSDHILPHSRSSHRHRPRHGGYATRHSTSDYISPPTEPDDDYIYPNHNKNQETAYHQDPRGFYDCQEQHEIHNYQPHHRSYARPSEYKTEEQFVQDTGFSNTHYSMHPHIIGAWYSDSHDQFNEIRDDYYQEEAQSGRPRSRRPVDKHSTKHNPVDYDSDPETCVEEYDSDAQKQGYSDVASFQDDSSRNRHRSRSHVGRRHRSSTPNDRYVRARSSSLSLRIQGCDTSSLSSGSGINRSRVRERNPSDSPVGRGRSSSLAASTSDCHRHRYCSRSPAAKNSMSITLSDYASSDDGHGRRRSVGSESRSDYMTRGGSEEYMGSDICSDVVVGSGSEDGYEDDCVENGSSDDDEYDEDGY
jgi:hypothetical protein